MNSYYSVVHIFKLTSTHINYLNVNATKAQLSCHNKLICIIQIFRMLSMRRRSSRNPLHPTAGIRSSIPSSWLPCRITLLHDWCPLWKWQRGSLQKVIMKRKTLKKYSFLVNVSFTIFFLLNDGIQNSTSTHQTRNLLHIKVIDSGVHTKVYDKRNDFRYG